MHCLMRALGAFMSQAGSTLGNYRSANNADTAVRSLYACSHACYNVASGRPCLVMQATPFYFLGDRRPQLAPAVTLRFGALTPCCGHGLDYRCRQPHHRGGNRNKLNSQFHGQITSLQKRRCCQHADHTPLTSLCYNVKTRINVPYSSNSFNGRRAA